MDEFEYDDLMDFEREDAHLPFIDEVDPEDDYEDDIYDDIAIFCARGTPKEDTSPRLADEHE